MEPTPAQDPAFKPLSLLVDPAGYTPCGVDLGREDARRAYWLNLFRDHFPHLLREAEAEAASRQSDATLVRQRCQQALAAFEQRLNEFERAPQHEGRLDILTICQAREAVLRRFGFDDPYRLVKHKQTESALTLLPALLAQLDALAPNELATRLVRGIFAGNIFDLGVGPTLELFRSGRIDFHDTLKRLRPRPWLVDDLDRWLDRWFNDPPHRAAVLFVDNAGCDVVLGMIPLARSLLQRGTDVILSANSTPSLNDITHAELQQLVADVSRFDGVVDQALNQGRLSLVSSGNGVPLIDLRACSRQLVDAVDQRGVDLVVLEGMGRALESNFNARLACDTLKIAMVKDAGVAEVYGGEVFDLVFRFDAAAGASG